VAVTSDDLTVVGVDSRLDGLVIICSAISFISPSPEAANLHPFTAKDCRTTMSYWFPSIFAPKFFKPQTTKRVVADGHASLRKEPKTLEAREAWAARQTETVNFQVASYKIQTSKTR